MIYKIGNVIHFRNEDGFIWIDEASHLTLTATTSRLLTYLLNHKDRVVLRDEILEHVWDAHGLRSSGHSLNKYISDLRNVFRSLGMTEEVIVTVPKQGFTISPDIEVTRISAPADAEHSAGATVPQTPDEETCEEPAAETVVKAKRPVSRTAVALLLFLIITALAAACAWYITERQRDERTVMTPGNAVGCPVIALSTFSAGTMPRAQAIVNDIIKRASLPCENGTYYFSASENVIAGQKGRVYLGRCSLVDGRQHQLNACTNYYKSDYEYPE